MARKELQKIQNIHDTKIAVFFKKSILKSILKILTMEHGGFRTIKAIKNIHRLFINLDLSKYQTSPELIAYIWSIVYISREWLDGMIDINLIFEKAKREPDFDNIKGEVISASINDTEPLTAPQVKMLFTLISEALQFGYVASMREEYLSLLEDIDLNNPAAFKDLVNRLFLISESIMDIKYNTNLVANKITFSTGDIDSVKESISQTISSLSKSNNILKIGIRRLNTLLSPGYMNGRTYVYLGLAGAGKSQPNNTMLPTPNGIMRIGDINVGDYVFNIAGNPVKVIGVYPQGVQDTYEVTFSDGRTARCNLDHLWYVFDNLHLKTPVVKSLREIIHTYMHEEKCRYYLPKINAVNFRERSIKIDPWVLGVVLGSCDLTSEFFELNTGNGFFAIQVAHILNLTAFKYNDSTWRFYIKKENKCDLNNTSVDGRLVKTADVLSEIPELINLMDSQKYIPDDYKFNSVEVRKKVLGGILDVSMKTFKRSKFFLKGLPKNLLEDIKSILSSLAYQYKEHADGSIDLQIPWECLLELITDPVKHAQVAKAKLHNIPSHSNEKVAITNIQRIGQDLQTCIRVDDPLHVFLTENFIPTHNSLLLLKTALDIRKYNPDFQPKTPGMKPCVLYITMENSFTETIERVWNLLFDDAITNYSEEEATEKIIKELNTAVGEEGPSIEVVIKYFSYREISTDDLFVIIQDLREDNLEVCALVFDYLLRIRPSISVADNALVELDRITNELKALAVMKDIPVITAHQMNRAAASIIDNAVRNNKGDATKLVGREHVASAFSIIMNVDFAAVLNMEYKPGTDERYMVINVVKRRRVDTNESEFAKYTYLAHPFAKKGIRLIDDMNLDKILSVQSLVTDIDGNTEKTNAVPRTKIMTSLSFEENEEDF